VKEAIIGGKPHRKNMKSEMVRDSGIAEIPFLVTATPFPQNRRVPRRRATWQPERRFLERRLRELD
jgi:hypothetical protein